MSTCGLVAITSASHAEGRQFDPGQVYVRSPVCALHRHDPAARATHERKTMAMNNCPGRAVAMYAMQIVASRTRKQNKSSSATFVRASCAPVMWAQTGPHPHVRAKLKHVGGAMRKSSRHPQACQPALRAPLRNTLATCMGKKRAGGAADRSRSKSQQLAAQTAAL